MHLFSSAWRVTRSLFVFVMRLCDLGIFACSMFDFYILSVCNGNEGEKKRYLAEDFPPTFRL